MPTILAADARNRALRTFLQGLGIDVAVAVATVLYTWLNSDADLSSREAWVGVGILLGKTALTTAASYVMRRFLDSSSVPTPLPPAPVPEPNTDELDDDQQGDAYEGAHQP